MMKIVVGILCLNCFCVFYFLDLVIYIVYWKKNYLFLYLLWKYDEFYKIINV